MDTWQHRSGQFASEMHDNVTSTINALLMYYHVHFQDVLGIALIGVISLGFYIAWKQRKLRNIRYSKWRGHMATGREREEEVKHILADAVTDLFEDLRYRDILTRHEVNRFYNLFARTCGITDLVPQNAKTVKSAIKERRARANGSGSKPVPIPDGPPEVALSTMLKRPTRKSSAAAA